MYNMYMWCLFIVCILVESIAVFCICGVITIAYLTYTLTTLILRYLRVYINRIMGKQPTENT